MNKIKLQDIENMIVMEIEVDTKEPSNNVVEIAKFKDEGIIKILYPKNMPESNGVRKNLESNLTAFKTMGAFLDAEVVESQVDTWLKGGFSKVDIDTLDYWTARKFEGSEFDEEQLKAIEQYKSLIDAVKAMNDRLKTVKLTGKGITFATYCKTKKSADKK